MQFLALTSLTLAGLVALAQASPLATGNVFAEVLADINATATRSAPETTSTGRPFSQFQFEPDTTTCGCLQQTNCDLMPIVLRKRGCCGCS
ncbi:hypothetical protein N0V93_002757 [Gnomoniopsis smithogilvyi]|uniref:Uncharacterized protein n=1 Tax=Gnomoniopsis smithogilvyi TaxID=1191159 RepID=A0A9W8YZF5_9PEZI|nr:hypothetical protein N0V93_002757 [Gnomoniopsis smithogilvyi]